MGGSDHDGGYEVTIDASGNLLIIGYFNGTVDLDPSAGIQSFTSVGNQDIFIQKLDTNGNLLWTRQIGGPLKDNGASITTDISDNILTTGFFLGTVDFDPGIGVHNLTSTGPREAFIQKLDANGNFLWVKQMKGSDEAYGIDISADASGNIYSTGWFLGTVDFNPGIGIESFISMGSDDIFVQKLDANGNFLWARQIGAQYGQDGRAVTIGINGDVYTTGFFYGTVDFNTGAGIQNLTSTGKQDIFIQKTDSDGNFQWAINMGGSMNDVAFSIVTDANDAVYTTGYFNGIVDFDPGAGVQDLTSAGNQDIFIQKLNQNSTGLPEQESETSVVVYPTLINRQFTIAFEYAPTDVEISIIDVQGRLISSSRYQNINPINLELNNPAGIYFVEIKTPKGKNTISVIKK
jgi:hypothetical protein